MHSLNKLLTLIDPTNLWPLRRGFLLIPLALACFALSPTALAVIPPPDGGYPAENTAEGENALFSLTIGDGNTAIGFNALYDSTTGYANTASGSQALFSNTTGFQNTATGVTALFSNTTGNGNVANGNGALGSNTNGRSNTASGFFALLSNTHGFNNTASGYFALYGNTTGDNNTASGDRALYGNTTGGSNIALGCFAGFNLTTGDNNIDIGNHGVAGEANTVRIGKQGTQTATFIAGVSGATVAGGVTVIIDSTGHLGVATSSARFKQDIKPMDKASEAILDLQPVTFHYRPELDPEGIPQFGLVAEQVEKVNPDLVARDEQGKPYTVRYEAVNAMLLNEFLKEHRKVEEQNRKNLEQDAIIVEQQKEIRTLTTSLKEQAAQIQKVSDELHASKATPQLVVANQ